MSWGKVDDKLHSHRKVRKISRKPIERLAAMGLWVLAMSHSCDVLSDGFIDRELVIQYAGSERAAEKLATSLVAAGFWEPVEGGWVFHDWAQYGPTRERAAAAQAQRIEAASRGGLAKAAAKNKELAVPTRHDTGSVPAPSAAAGNVLPSPVPDPVPVPEREHPLPPQGGAGVLSVQEIEPKRSRKTPATYCPKSDATPEAVDAWCRSHGLPPASQVPEVERMLNSHRKRGIPRADWLATWRDWQTSPYQQGAAVTGVRASPQPGPEPGQSKPWAKTTPIGG